MLLASSDVLPPAELATPVWLDAMSAAVGGVFGALTARRADLDVMGALFIAVATGIGGGLIRDTLLQRGTPAALTNPWLVPTALGAALVGLLFARPVVRLTLLLTLLDALFLGIYSIVGTEKAFRADLPLLSCVLLGVVTGVGGGLLRDILVGDRPMLLLPGAVYASAAAGGTTLFTVALALGGSTAVWFVPALALTVLMRLGSLRFGWNTPGPAAVDARMATVTSWPARLVRRSKPATPGGPAHDEPPRPGRGTRRGPDQR
ncbi:trimeric intracellular cation channel family protein [Cryptosporangium minutisporangium]|uniref:Glycine transporter domain-containing protein n=1 Tax=Cryptosporangium minutisporangium TaxID=113569 RepID=A0ABP6SZI5_9ACTN